MELELIIEKKMVTLPEMQNSDLVLEKKLKLYL